jgi:hypothetical protein
MDFEPRVIEKQFETIDELLSAYYDVRVLSKADVPASTQTSNYRNILYGKKLWLQMNVKPNTFTAIPRTPYESSGWRVMPDFASAVSDGVGVVEAGTIPAAQVPVLKILELTPKTMVCNPYAITMAQQRLAGKDDVATWDELMNALAIEFPMRINYSMLAKHETALAGNNYESIDRICCSYSEVSSCSTTTNYGDYAGINRDASGDSWADAYVAHNNNVDRTLTLSLMDTVMTNVMPYWLDYGTEKKVWITGFDVVERMQSLAASQQRFMGWNNYVMTYNGVKTIPGEAIGFGVSQYRGIPVIADMYVQKDTLSRMYLLDTNFVNMAVLVPPSFIEDRSYLARRALTTLATYYMLGELVCTKFRNQGKIRDLL